MKKNQLSLCYICLQMFLIVILLSTSASAQSNEDSIIYQKKLKTSINVYKYGMQENARIFNGPIYSFATKQSYGSPFWKADTLINGNIYYDDNYYSNVPLKYDLVNQIIVTTNYSNSVQIALLNSKIKNFSISNHQFFKIDAEKNNYKNITTGFYDNLYWGKRIVWLKRIKELKFGSNAENQVDKFQPLNEYYIQEGNNFIVVKSKKEILEALKNFKNEVNKFIKDNKLNFNADFENALIAIVKYYDQLKN